VFHPLKKIDWPMMFCIFLLAGIGLVSIYSSSIYKGDFLNFKKQIIFLGLGFSLMFVLIFLDLRSVIDNSDIILFFYIVCCLLLAGLFFFSPGIRNVKSWYKLGPVSLDPFEFTKIVLIALLAKYFSRRHIEMYRFRHILISGAFVLAPVLLVFFQPNLGSSLILILIWLTILIVSGIRLRHFLILLLCGIIILIFSWFYLLHDYQKQRVVSFLFPQLSQPLGVGWSQRQAKIAIGGSGILGKGFGQGSQTQYGFLPEPQTDFIFAAIGEEFGLFGAVFLVFLFVFLTWRIMRRAFFAQNNFSRLFASGMAAFLFGQVFIHIGMNVGLLPIIGIPLPLVSYGGSGLMAICIGLGILLSIKAQESCKILELRNGKSSRIRDRSIFCIFAKNGPVPNT
jgi:rod shape determining protein RodA